MQAPVAAQQRRLASKARATARIPCLAKPAGALELDFLRPVWLLHQQRQSSTEAKQELRAAGGAEDNPHESNSHSAPIPWPSSSFVTPRKHSRLSRRPDALPLDYSERDPVREIRRLGQLHSSGSFPHLDATPFAFSKSPEEEAVQKREIREQNKAVWCVHHGLAEQDWDQAFHKGWKVLHKLGERQDRLDMMAAEGMLRLAMTLPAAIYLKDWGSIHDTLLLNLCKREWGMASPGAHRSVVAEWAWHELCNNTAESKERIHEFWTAFIARTRKIVDGNSTQRNSYGLLEIPTSFFNAVVAAHAASPNMTLRQFLDSFVHDIAIPNHFAAHRARIESRSMIEPTERSSARHNISISQSPQAVEINSERVSLWYRQMELVRIWARIGEFGVRKACNQWRARSNPAAAGTIWDAFTEAVQPANERDRWMEIDWTDYGFRRDKTVRGDGLLTKVDKVGQRTVVEEEQGKSPDTNFGGILGLSNASSMSVASRTPSAITGRPKLPAHFTQSIVSEFLHTFLHLGKRGQAEAVWTYVVTTLGLKPSSIMWTGVLLGYSHQRDSAAVEAAFHRMQTESGVQPDAVCWSILINSYFRSGQNELGLQKTGDLLEDAEIKKTFPDGKLPIRAYNVIINALLWNGLHDAATNVLKRMREEKVRLDIYTVNVFIRYYSRARSHSLSGIAEVLKLVEEYDLRPDVVTFTTILDALLRAGRGDAVEKIQKIMESTGVKGNSVTYGAMIDHLVKDSTATGKEDGLRAAIELLRNMQESPPSSTPSTDAKPTEITYTSLVHGFAQYSLRFGSKPHLQMAEELHREMQQLGFQANHITYNALMAANLAHNEIEQALEHFDKYRSLKRRRSRQSSTLGTRTSEFEMMDEEHLISESVPIAIWQALLAGLVAKKQFPRAKGVVQEMRELGVDFRSGSLQKLEETIMSNARDLG
ncbi:MAG: hypothetical protein CYPHOPRED_001597 [Cyphobasidiales sp. Tagirdzhanova-0007]|nr:MAG: hypothetical protein CYPHOPRED_001597 [Cyphobasidiales sp. Tagirdzhanova-0007]